MSLVATMALAAAATTGLSAEYEAPPTDASTEWNMTMAPDQSAAAIRNEITAAAAPAGAEAPHSNAADLAKQLNNPIAALISVPFQNNFDWGGGPNQNGFQWKMNVQPVIPITINDDWNLITRTIIPVVSQRDIAGTPDNPSGTQTGIGDILFSARFSPQELTKSGWTWGVGPAVNLKTGSDTLLGSGKWAMGPTAVALKQKDGWTVGALAFHTWSVGGDDDRADVSSTFMQPFLAYTTDHATTFTINTESAYNWEADQWAIPVNLMVSQLVHFGKQPVQLQVGGRYYADAPEYGPKWGARANITFLFPK